MSVRIITDHRLNGLNDAIVIAAVGKPEAIGANTRYALTLHPGGIGAPPVKNLDIEFQNGPIAKPDDFNGWTNEALIAIVIDRLRGFQGENPKPEGWGTAKNVSAAECVTLMHETDQWGKFRCRENAEAKTLLETALMWLQKRTRDRMARGVEGTHRQ